MRSQGTRHSRLRVAVPALIALAWGAVVCWPAGNADARAAVSLTDDDGGLALFPTGTPLVPAASRTACVAVQAAGAVSGDAVTLAAVDVAGTLAARMTVTIELGSGGSFGDCSGFTGVPVWSGTLAALAAASSGDGVTTQWAPADVPRRSFRLTAAVMDDPAAAGASASATFVWRLVPGGPPSTDPSTPSPSVSPSSSVSRPPTTSPSPTSPSPTSPSPTGQPVTSHSVTSPSPSPAGTGSGGPAGGGRPGTRPDLVLHRNASGLSGMLQRALELGVAGLRDVIELIVDVCKVPEYPVGMFLLVAIFLAVQNRIDRADPKLARAAVRERADDLEFRDLVGRPPRHPTPRSPA